MVSRIPIASSAGVGVLALIAVVEMLSSPSLAQDGPGPSAKLFSKRCASCHTVPDASFQTDKAWLGQILETS